MFHLRLAARAIRTNRLRSALTMLGIVIGVASVIAMLAIGAGARERVASQIASLGANLIDVVPGSVTQGGVRAGSGARASLTDADAQAIRREIPEAVAVAPVVRNTVQAINGNLNWATHLHGTTPDFFIARDWGVSRGRLLTEEDMEGSPKVALLGRTVVRNLFGDRDPLGATILVRRVPLTVVGLLEPKGQSVWGNDQDDVVMVPLATAKVRILGANPANRRSVGSITVETADAALLEPVAEQIRQLLRQRHRLQPGDEDDFTIRIMSEVFDAMEASGRVLSLLLAAVAAVSLVVGGIGIMNIMLVSVTERTREIGLRRAIGARRGDIRAQFLTEAVALCLLGGLTGIALGCAASWAMGALAGWSVSVSPASLLLALCFAAGVGLFFGWYPARKAAALDPIEALRYE